MMQRTKIEWTDYVWNPIKGICPVGCWYCYARRIYQRFGRDSKPRLTDEKDFFSPVNRWKNLRARPAKIFVCSTFELFHPVADKWRDQIFQVIELDRLDIFIILTKMPERIDRSMPENVWLGVSVTGQEPNIGAQIAMLAETDAKIKFISFEPLLQGFYVENLFYEFTPDWIILGRLTGYGNKHDTSLFMVQEIVEFAQEKNIPIFLKDNLREIWGEPLIQEWPAGRE